MKTTTRSLLLLALTSVSLAAWAGPVSEHEARRKAMAFVAQHQKGDDGAAISLARRSRTTTPAPTASYYLFNVGQDEGFVIVSGDDRTVPILGYADHGSIDGDNLPEGLSYLLDGYAEQMAWLDSHPEAARAAATTTTRTAISPLIKSKWNQGAPYNNQCPEITTDGQTSHTVTGCVATAMAQVMYYHQWPASTTKAIPGYTIKPKNRNGESIDVTLNELSVTTFGWDAMTTTYTTSSTGAGADAVAKLMRYCGQSLRMNYGINSSSSYNVTVGEALTTYFNYDGTTTYVDRAHYTYQQWVGLLYNELASGRPVVLGGQSAGGGHSFVCDGYDTDDYFHINWGWGGSSDGYYRLSALNPWEQGIGGSSTLDGFSFSQDAIIGIRPYDGNAPYTVLTLDAFGLSDGSVSKTFTRESTDVPFADIALKLNFYNLNRTATDFDYAVILTKEEGEQIQEFVTSETVSLGFNKSIACPLTISSDANLTEGVCQPDGTYYLKVVSRVHDQDEWAPCHDSEALKLSYTVSGTTLTIGAPMTSVAPTSATITVEGTPTVGYEQEVIASVKGSDAADFHGNIYFYVGDTFVMAKQVDIPAGQTVDIRYSFTPSATGEQTLYIKKNKTAKITEGYVIGSQPITVAASDATNALELAFTADISNKTSDGKLYGNALRATVTATNASAENSYSGKLNCSTRLWTITETSTDNGDGTTTINTSWSFESLGVTTYPLIVAKSGSATVDIAINDLPDNLVTTTTQDDVTTTVRTAYSFRFTYLKNDETVDAIHLGLSDDSEDSFGTLNVCSGYSVGDAAGLTTIYPSGSTITVGDACFVDLRSCSDLSSITITPGTNPNCLYLLATGATVPSSLQGLNVVCGDEAASLTLTDEHPFYSPIAFTAQEASYTRTFTLAAAGTSGWSTLCLPFAVSSVTSAPVLNGSPVPNGSPVKRKWFTSDDDTDGAFWLRSFVDDADGRVNFAHAQQLSANTPYIIAVPGNTWGDEWQMTNTPVTFSATDAEIAATGTASVSGNHYKFCGSTTTSTLGSVYALNDAGSRFVKKAAYSSPAFRGWFEGVSITSLTLPSLSIGNAHVSGIRTVGTATAPAATGWYTLDGRRLSSKPTVRGLYINNGKKVIIK